MDILLERSHKHKEDTGAKSKVFTSDLAYLIGSFQTPYQFLNF